jgi:hypothetical protein
MDSNGVSFMFSLRNPAGDRPRVFPLRPTTRHFAICCCSTIGPRFGAGPDLYIANDCEVTDGNITGGFGDTYDTGAIQDRDAYLAGGRTFRVLEIEVFEVVR